MFIQTLHSSQPAGRIGDFGNFFSGFAKSLNIEWVQFVFQNCEILRSVRGLHDKNSASYYCFTSDVMYKWCKRLVYTHPDLLARFCKVNLSNAKNLVWFFFPGLINLRWSRAIIINVIEDDYQFLGVHIRLSIRWSIQSWTVSKLLFSKIT